MAPYSPVHSVGVTIIPKDETQSTTPAPREFHVDGGAATAIAVGHIVFKEADGNVALATDTVVPNPKHKLLGIVSNVWVTAGSRRERPRNGVLPASTAGVVEVIPFANIAAIEMTEDAVGGPINFPTKGDVVTIVQSVLGTAATDNTTLLNSCASVLIDSSAVADAGTVATAFFTIAGVADPYGDQRPSGDTTSARRYRLVPVAAQVQSAV